jgi:hypothetical protein
MRSLRYSISISVAALVLAVGLAACKKSPEEEARDAAAEAAATASASDAAAAAASPAADQSPAAQASTDAADTDLPSDARLHAIAVRAEGRFERTYKSEGLGGVMSADEACYQGLTDASSGRARAYCLLFDMAAYYFEQSVDPKFRAADEQINPFLTNENFSNRLQQNTPPFTGPDAEARKEAAGARVLHAYRSI